jgi:hypothetical protein
MSGQQDKAVGREGVVGVWRYIVCRIKYIVAGGHQQYTESIRAVEKCGANFRATSFSPRGKLVPQMAEKELTAANNINWGHGSVIDLANGALI